MIIKTAPSEAHIHDPLKVRSFINRYCRLLDAVSREPELTIDELLAKTPMVQATTSGIGRSWKTVRG
jgi:hypothetical protein